MKLQRLAAATAAGVLLLPAAAQAKPGNGKGHGGDKQPGPPAHAQAPHAAPAPVAPAPVHGPAKTAPAKTTVTSDATTLAGETAAPTKTERKATKRSTKTARRIAKPRTFIFKGTVSSVDVEAGTVVVDVTSGNAIGRRFKGETVTFDLASGKVSSVETDGVLGITLADVLAGDKVVVQARLARATTPDGSTLTARKLTDQTEREPVLVEEPVVEEQEPAPVVDEPLVEEQVEEIPAA